MFGQGNNVVKTIYTQVCLASCKYDILSMKSFSNQSFVNNSAGWLGSSLQIRRALLQIFFPEKPFSWLIHIGIAFCLIVVVNLLVMFVPSIRDIFGIIGG